MAMSNKNSAKPLAAASTRSQNRKGVISPAMTRLTPSETESLLNDMRESMKVADELLKNREPTRVRLTTKPARRGAFCFWAHGIACGRGDCRRAAAAARRAARARRGAKVERGESLSDIERQLRNKFLGKIGAWAEQEPIKARMAKLSDRWQAKLVQGIFDQFAPLKGISATAYMQARLSKAPTARRNTWCAMVP